MLIKESYLAMIKAMSGGWGAMCGAMVVTRDALENRIYERKNRALSVDEALLMQSFSGTTFFAQAVATASGGTFVKLPEGLSDANDVLMSKFNELYRELGQFSKDFADATADDIVDNVERKILEADGARLHKVLAELQAITFRVYCPNQGMPENEGEQ